MLFQTVFLLFIHSLYKKIVPKAFIFKQKRDCLVMYELSLVTLLQFNSVKPSKPDPLNTGIPMKPAVFVGPNFFPSIFNKTIFGPNR